MKHPDLSRVSLVTSNRNKLAEYMSFGIEGLKMMPGADLDEVLGTPDEVIVHKAIAAGDGTLVEDSILIVDGEVLVDARWRISEIDSWHGKTGVWEVRLGVNQDGQVYVFKGSVSGTFGPKRGNGFDFDPYFYIAEEGMTLAELKQIGRKDEYSARKRAAAAMLDNRLHLVKNISDILPWTGAFQHQSTDERGYVMSDQSTLEQRLNRARNQGLLHCSVTMSSRDEQDVDEAAASVAQKVLDNILRMREKMRLSRSS